MRCTHCGRVDELEADRCQGCGRPLTGLEKGSLLASRYEIVERLGFGAMGTVYKAWDRMLEELVALKVRQGRADARDEASRRFRNEIKLARKVSHPNVCRVHDYGEDSGLVYLSMSLLVGTDLATQLERCPEGLPPHEAFDVAMQIAEGLGAIHAVGILHRDLKAANILRDVSGVVQVTDFGVAKDAIAGSQGLTGAGIIVGTPEYMSPEQCRGEPLDLRSDIYSFGVLLWQIFTGELPFRGDSRVATLFMHVKEAPPFGSGPGARLPGPVASILEKTLAKDPEQRHGSIHELKAELRNARGEVVTEKTDRPALSPRRPLLSELRAHERFDIPIGFRIQRFDAHGAVVAEEMTVSDNISRGGACLRTALPDVAVDEVLLLREVDGDFEAKVVVRNLRTGDDGIDRIGVQFVGCLLPDRLLPWAAPESVRRAAKTALDESEMDTVVARVPEGLQVEEGPHSPERRRQARYAIHVELVLHHLDAGGEAVAEERTISENFSRQGARVFTARSGIPIGHCVVLEEVGGDFRTRAVVRHRFVGSDGIQRLGLQFLDGPAPARLVPEDEPHRES